MPRMAFVLPQFGIFAQGTHAHHFLEFDLRPGVTPTAGGRLVPAAARARGLAGGVNLVIAFGADAWREVAPAWRRRRSRPSTGSTGPTAAARRRPSTTPGSGSAAATPDVTWEHARAAAAAVDDVALLAAERPAFTYRDGRD